MCGGEGDDIESDCLKLESEDGYKTSRWVHFSSLQNPRFGHSSWVSPAGLHLIGTDGSNQETTEIVNHQGESVKSFDQHNGKTLRFTCAIPLDNTVVVTGGYEGKLSGVVKTVTEYNAEVKCKFYKFIL